MGPEGGTGKGCDAVAQSDRRGPADKTVRLPPLVVGVMGSAAGRIDPVASAASRRLGRCVAEAGCTLMTGACPGLPYDAVLGAAEAGGLVVGISPALGEAEHVARYRSPVEGFDVLVYTGSGLMGREVVNIRSADMVVIVAGHSGTLGELAIAYDEGRLIGVLTGTGGVADMAEEIVGRLDKETGSVILYDDDPARLLERLLQEYRSSRPGRPSALREPRPEARSAGAPAPG